MTSIFSHADDVLRCRGWVVGIDKTPRRLMTLIMLLIIFAMAYGAVMGSYGSFVGQRVWQVLYFAVKMPLLLTATFIISLPSFFVINTLLGLRDDFSASLRALLATQAGLTIILASFAPFTALWYVSTSNYDTAVLFNLMMFAIASITVHVLLKRFYKPLIDANRRHRIMLRIWLVISGFVGIQMGWVLRSFIGAPNAPTHFFRQEAWGNAYLHIFKAVWRLLGVNP
jgi:hypothetical protein